MAGQQRDVDCLHARLVAVEACHSVIDIDWIEWACNVHNRSSLGSMVSPITLVTLVTLVTMGCMANLQEDICSTPGMIATSTLAAVHIF